VAAALVKQLLEEERKDALPATITIDETTVAGAVEAALVRKEAEREAAANEKDITAALTTKFGDKAKDALASAATELGLNMEELRELVRRKPALARKALGLSESAARASSPFLSSVNVNTLKPAEPAPPKPVMFGATSSEIADAWKYAGAVARKKLGLD
jgi:hypothetical protein